MTGQAGPRKADRGTPLEQLSARWPNFRDLGGIPVAGGRKVRPGRFLRAPALADLDPDAEARLAAIDPALIVDFRSDAEAEERPIALPAPLAERRLRLAVEPAVNRRFRKLFESPHPPHDAVAEAMTEVYRDFVRLHAEPFARFLAATLDAGDRPVIFHCTAGKDRTGFAAALVLAALGASPSEVERDYLASSRLWRPDPDLEALLPISARAAVFGVDPRYLRAAFDELDRAHGGAAAFAESALGGSKGRRAWTALAVE